MFDKVVETFNTHKAQVIRVGSAVVGAVVGMVVASVVISAEDEEYLELEPAELPAE